MVASSFQFLPRGDQLFRFHTDCSRNIDQVRFMRFEETEQCCKQRRLGSPATQADYLARGDTAGFEANFGRL